MSTLVGLVNLVRNTLQADQAALNATANNVANQNTVGYTDEAVSWQSGVTVTLSGNIQSAAAPTVSVNSLRDRVLDQRVQQQTQTQSSTSAEAAVLSQMESVFSITGSSTAAGSTAIGTALNSFFSSLTALSANPSDGPTQQNVLSAAQTLASAFNAAATGLAAVQKSVNSNLAGSVTQVNALTSSIAALTQQIQSISPNQDAGQLEDQRQSDITQLSKLIGLNQITTESNGLTLTTTGGALLVLGNQSFALSSGQTPTGTEIYDSSGNDITSAVSGGSIGGELTAQGVDLPAATSALDNLAYQIATAMNTQNEAGTTPSGTAGQAIFTVPNPPTATGTAAQLSVIPTTPGSIATAATGEGATGNGNANALANLGTATNSNGLTMNGALSALLSVVGSTSSTLQEENTTQQASLTQLTTQQSTLSGVNLDTEASNLTQYQRAYQAASQMFAILNTLMASAINMGQATTVQ
jgi:flagellar hook-associated protein 1 FlgK